MMAGIERLSGLHLRFSLAKTTTSVPTSFRLVSSFWNRQGGLTIRTGAQKTRPEIERAVLRLAKACIFLDLDDHPLAMEVVDAFEQIMSRSCVNYGGGTGTGFAVFELIMSIVDVYD
ncbi:unnamed protein product [Peronospora belbahrii]|uniref:Tubulin/FtsZ GTPase domain-containing protein n=1 Tax=Peronospora belbahrii TaxID=622444 RepID=A0ABN8CQK6_9STRA|nr:unnamed protein product [Peronospora belbahrii]